MPEALDPCCQRALAEWVRKIDEHVSSYPVIQDRPCPTCRQIIKVRVYAPREEELAS
jgi:hypothetical protein